MTEEEEIALKAVIGLAAIKWGNLDDNANLIMDQAKKAIEQMKLSRQSDAR